MDFEYDDDVDQQTIDRFAKVIKDHPFEDEEIREVFRVLVAGEEPVVLHDMFSFDFRESDIRDSRITRLCKSFDNHIFRIQFLNGSVFIIRLNSNRSYTTEIEIINAAAGVGVEVPRSYFSHSLGIKIGSQAYYAMLQENVPGKDFLYAATHKLISTGDKEVILEEMGKRLRLIHSVTHIDGQQQEDLRAGFYSDALELLNNERTSIIEIGIATLEDFEDLYAKLDSLRDAAKIFGGDAFGLTHNDFHPKHIILNLEAGRPTIKAIIDWGDAEFTNTFFDFALWDYWCGEDFLVDSLMESYGMEVFASAESKVIVEITTIASLINLLCKYSQNRDMKATQLGIWQRLRHEVAQATY